MKLTHDLRIALKGAGIAFHGKIVGTGVRYFTQIVLARFLGVYLYGIFALGIVVGEVAALLARMGLQTGAIRYVSIYRSKGDDNKLKGVLLTSIVLPLFFGAILGIAIFLTSTRIAQDIFNTPELALVLQILSLSIPFWTCMIIIARSTTGFLTTKYLVLLREYIQPFVNLILVIIFYLLGHKLIGATWAWVLSFMLGFAFALFYLRRIFPGLTQKHIQSSLDVGRLLRFSLPLAFGDFFLFFLTRVDILILGYYQPPSDVGVYRAASQTALLLLVFLVSFNNIFAPMIAEIFHVGDHERLKQLFRVITRWSFILSLPFFLIIIVNAKNILNLFGSKFVMGWLALVILAAAQLINASTGGIANVLTMSGHQYQKLLGDIVIVCVHITLNLILIPRWGILGASVATGLSIATVNLLRVIQVYLTLGFHAYSLDFLKVVGVGIFSGAIGTLVPKFLPADRSLLSLLVTTSVVILVYSGLILWKCLEKTDMLILKEIQNKLKFS
jgi:O-antigen/teichoic acid export membrane protein